MSRYREENSYYGRRDHFQPDFERFRRDRQAAADEEYFGGDSYRHSPVNRGDREQTSSTRQPVPGYSGFNGDSRVPYDGDYLIPPPHPPPDIDSNNYSDYPDDPVHPSGDFRYSVFNRLDQGHVMTRLGPESYEGQTPIPSVPLFHSNDPPNMLQHEHGRGPVDWMDVMPRPLLPHQSTVPPFGAHGPFPRPQREFFEKHNLDRPVLSERSHTLFGQTNELHNHHRGHNKEIATSREPLLNPKYREEMRRHDGQFNGPLGRGMSLPQTSQLSFPPLPPPPSFPRNDFPLRDQSPTRYGRNSRGVSPLRHQTRQLSPRQRSPKHMSPRRQESPPRHRSPRRGLSPRRGSSPKRRSPRRRSSPQRRSSRQGSSPRRRSPTRPAPRPLTKNRSPSRNYSRRNSPPRNRLCSQGSLMQTAECVLDQSMTRPMFSEPPPPSHHARPSPSYHTNESSVLNFLPVDQQSSTLPYPVQDNRDELQMFLNASEESRPLYNQQSSFGENGTQSSKFSSLLHGSASSRYDKHNAPVGRAAPMVGGGFVQNSFDDKDRPRHERLERFVNEQLESFSREEGFQKSRDRPYPSKSVTNMDSETAGSSSDLNKPVQSLENYTHWVKPITVSSSSFVSNNLPTITTQQQLFPPPPPPPPLITTAGQSDTARPQNDSEPDSPDSSPRLRIYFPDTTSEKDACDFQAMDTTTTTTVAKDGNNAEKEEDKGEVRMQGITTTSPQGLLKRDEEDRNMESVCGGDKIDPVSNLLKEHVIADQVLDKKDSSQCNEDALPPMQGEKSENESECDGSNTVDCEETVAGSGKDQQRPDSPESGEIVSDSEEKEEGEIEEISDEIKDETPSQENTFDTEKRQNGGRSMTSYNQRRYPMSHSSTRSDKYSSRFNRIRGDNRRWGEMRKHQYKTSRYEQRKRRKFTPIDQDEEKELLLLRNAALETMVVAKPKQTPPPVPPPPEPLKQDCIKNEEKFIERVGDSIQVVDMDLVTSDESSISRDQTPDITDLATTDEKTKPPAPAIVKATKATTVLPPAPLNSAVKVSWLL